MPITGDVQARRRSGNGPEAVPTRCFAGRCELFARSRHKDQLASGLATTRFRWRIRRAAEPANQRDRRPPNVGPNRGGAMHPTAGRYLMDGQVEDRHRRAEHDRLAKAAGRARRSRADHGKERTAGHLATVLARWILALPGVRRRADGRHAGAGAAGIGPGTAELAVSGSVPDGLQQGQPSPVSPANSLIAHDPQGAAHVAVLASHEHPSRGSDTGHWAWRPRECRNSASLAARTRTGSPARDVDRGPGTEPHAEPQQVLGAGQPGDRLPSQPQRSSSRRSRPCASRYGY